MASFVTKGTVVSYTAFPPLHVQRTCGISLLHWPWSHLHRTLSGILPYEARTFLSHVLSELVAAITCPTYALLYITFCRNCASAGGVEKLFFNCPYFPPAPAAVPPPLRRRFARILDYLSAIREHQLCVLSPILHFPCTVRKRCRRLSIYVSSGPDHQRFRHHSLRKS